MFATAAIVDAVRKEDRRKELDRQLNEARKELIELQQQDPSSAGDEASKAQLSLVQMDSVWQSLKVIYRNRPYMKEIHMPATLSADELVNSLKRDYYNTPEEADLHASREVDFDMLENTILSEELDRRIISRESRNPAHLLFETRSIDLLVKRLLLRAQIFDTDRTESQSFQEAKKMVEQGCSNYTFPSINADRAARHTSLLNAQIRALVKASDLGIKERIGRICYNLLISAHPPNMHTYNTLIVAFDKAGHHVFSEAVVHSFFQNRLLRPTPSTFTAILNHYRLSGNHGQFLRAVACLTGADDCTGGKIRRRHISDFAEVNRLRKQAAKNKSRTRTGEWWWDHVPLNKALIEAILGGLLRFRLFDHAAYLFVVCVQSGISLSSRAVKQLFDESIAALDWQAAIRLVQGMAASPRKWDVSLSRHDSVTASHLVRRLLAMMDLCGLHIYDYEADEERLEKLNVSAPNLSKLFRSLAKSTLLLPDMDAGGFQRPGDGAADCKRRLLQIESLWKDLRYVQKTTLSIESKLLGSAFNPSFRVSMALHIAKEAIQQSVALTLEGGTLLAQRRHFHDEREPAEGRFTRHHYPRLPREDEQEGTGQPAAMLVVESMRTLKCEVGDRKNMPGCRNEMSAGARDILGWPESARREAYVFAPQPVGG